MPFSSDGDTIDFIYGVINWKDVGEAAEVPQVIRAALPPLEPETDELEDEDVTRTRRSSWATRCWTVERSVEPMARSSPSPDCEPEAEPRPPMPHLSWEDGPLADPEPSPSRCEAEEPAIELDADAGLADRLWAARESAEVCKQAGRPQPRRALSRAGHGL